MDKKCIGCGSVLQCKDENKEGYIPSKVLDKALYCERCFKIKNYSSSKEVEKIVDTDSLCLDKDYPAIFVVDSLTMNDNVFSTIKSIKNKVYIVITKKDLFPKSVKDIKIINYVKNKTNIEDVYVVSSLKKYNVESFYKVLLKDNVKKAYVVGFSNAGKSAFINSIAFINNKESNILVSPVVNTTLENIEVKLNDLTLIDTPGLFDKYSLSSFIDASSFKNYLPKKEIKPRIYVLKTKDALIVGDILRIETSEETHLSFYIANNININKYNASKKTFLTNKDKLDISINSNMDIVINGVGFIKIIKGSNVKVYSINNSIISLREKLI